MSLKHRHMATTIKVRVKSINTNMHTIGTNHLKVILSYTKLSDNGVV